LLIFSQGEFVEGMMHGHGKFIWASGLQYEGEFSHNCVTGKGTYTWPDKRYFEEHSLTILLYNHIII